MIKKIRLYTAYSCRKGLFIYQTMNKKEWCQYNRNKLVSPNVIKQDLIFLLREVTTFNIHYISNMIVFKR